MLFATILALILPCVPVQGFVVLGERTDDVG
jgi:hypothetical protein